MPTKSTKEKSTKTKEKVEKDPSSSSEKSAKKKVYADKALTVPKRMVPTGEKRSRKTVSRYVEESAESAKIVPQEIVIKKGKGKKFEDCPQVLSQINRRTRDDDLLRMIHTILLGRVNKKVQIKANLKSFSGIVYEEDKDRDYLEAKFERHKTRDVRDMAKFFGVDPTGEKEEVIKEIVDFLEKPKAYDVSSSSEKKATKRSSSSKKSTKSSKSSSEKKTTTRKKKDPDAPKRPLSAFFIFSNEKREEVRKKLGKEAKITEVAKKLASMWKKVDEDEKNQYQKEANKLKEAYEKRLKKYNKKKEKEKEKQKSESESEKSDKE